VRASRRILQSSQAQLDLFDVTPEREVERLPVSSRLLNDRRGRLLAGLKEAGGYAAAVVLPWIGTNLGLHVHALQSTPFALTYASIAGITLFWSVRQGLLATIFSTIFFNYYVIPPVRAWALSGRGLLYSAIIFGIGLFVTWLCHRQNVIGARLRAALASYRAQTEALMEAQQGSNSVAWTYSIAEGRVRWAEAGAEVFGRPFADLTARDLLLSLIVEEDRGQFEALRQTGTAKIFHAEYRVRWPNGEIHWLESRGTPSPLDAGIWRGVTIDVTDRKNAELALIRSEKLAAIGRLSATIAHEINNPLEVVTNLLYLALLDESLTQQTRMYLKGADQQLARLASISRHTLTFARSNLGEGPTKAGEVVESVVAMFQPRCRELRLLRTVDATVATPVDDLRQIMTNLVSNACDAVVGIEGVVEIEITAEPRWAVIEVRDNGSGIAPENLGRIFDAFFTTKEGVGTGIGLWVTKELAEKNGGGVSAEIRDRQLLRTAFRVKLPLAEAVGPAGL
jgi:signal transduction histidine kinase